MAEEIATTHSSLTQEVTLQQEDIEKIFYEQGLIYLGSSQPILEPKDHEIYSEWIAEDMHAEMDFLKRNMEIRRNIQNVMPDTQTVLSFALPYSRSSDSKPRISGYAKIADYHKSMKRLAKQAISKLIEFNKDLSGIRYRICVDSAPIAERTYASKATGSKGFIGKSSMFIHAQYGTFLLLGEILVDIKISPGQSENPVDKDSTHLACGTCKRCKVHCPTGALSQDYQVDSRKCLSYWTIEHRGLVPKEYWPHFAKYWYGCDICQDVCPYNRTKRQDINSSIKKTTVSIPNHSGCSIDLFSIVTMTQHEYEMWFGGTAMTRAKRLGLRRNALIALWATKDNRLPEAIKICLASDENLLRETAKQM